MTGTFIGISIVCLGLMITILSINLEIDKKFNYPTDGYIETVLFKDKTGTWEYDDGTKVGSIKLLVFRDKKN